MPVSPPEPKSSEDLVHQNRQFSKNGRNDSVSMPVWCDSAVRAVDNLGVNFYALAGSVDDPVLRNSVLGVESTLLTSIL